MNLTPDQVLAVLREIGSTVHVRRSHHDTCKTQVTLSNGWVLDIFDECCAQFDYLQGLQLPGEPMVDFWELPYDVCDSEGRPTDNEWSPVRHWSPTEEQRQLMCV